MSTARITRDDLEAKFRTLKSDVDETAETAKNYALAAAVVAGVVIFTVAFAVGRRRGRRSSTVVEIRRI